jgi:hypothetical protein
MGILRPAVFAAALVAATTFAAVAAADCTCRAGGRDYDLGQAICLNTPAGFRLATCDMVLNNTSWKISAAPCVDASAASSGTPDQPWSLHSRHSHAHHPGG